MAGCCLLRDKKLSIKDNLFLVVVIEKENESIKIRHVNGREIFGVLFVLFEENVAERHNLCQLTVIAWH